MKFEGITAINAPREKVWTALIDPYLVSQCAPGLQSMEVIDPNKLFKASVSVGFGAVKVNFDANVEFVELREPDFAQMRAHGKAPGSGVDVRAEMRLSDGQAGVTELGWTADVVVVGTIASMASRLMGGITQKLTNQFFDCIKAKIEA